MTAPDAISVISGERDGRLALCASPTCRTAFCDTSRSRTRRWCEMNTCGNRQKKASFNAHKHGRPGSEKKQPLLWVRPGARVRGAPVASGALQRHRPEPVCGFRPTC
ncbi:MULTISPECIES: CGNR zinc finger domain-containing protein [unclassified Nocardiopsis]|uniref:CGNR zinc finger domain-containing protein n=1 Tax=unclassified Nocardiopsis TaxID=2649073 RepID=UPI001F20B5F4|nr:MULTISPECIES: CGNR zinc finger domain-containing protein [unclassified Nocardiopsis]